MSKELGKPQSNSDVINEEPRVLLVGYGWVGQYCGKYFKNADIFTSKGFNKREFEDYDLAIIGVPTPMNRKTGQCDVSIVEESVKKFRGIAKNFLIKSTVEIGTTDRLSKKYNVDIAMSPEYVGETLGHPLLEPKRDNFLIIGGKDGVAHRIASFWRLVLHANAPIHICTAVEAEIIKYCENLWIMQRVDYWNDVYEVCQTFGGMFDRVREGIVLDPRMNRTHSFVYPNNRGWSGKCLPKDMNSLAYSMRKKDNPLKTVEHQINKNTKRRAGYNNSEQLIPDKPLWQKEI